MQDFIKSKLRPHQVEPVNSLTGILQKYQSAVDLSDTGTGKTYVACAVAAGLQLSTLVIVPKIAISAWERVAEHFDTRHTVIGYEHLRTGKTGFGHWRNPLPDNATEQLEYFKCQCCQLRVDLNKYFPCYTHPLGIHCLETKKATWDYGSFQFNPNFELVIFDEIHRCGGLDSLNSEMLIAAKRQNIKVLGLSATAACSPLQMRALGYNLDLHNDKHDLLGGGRVTPNFYKWANRYGCRRDPRFHGFKWMVGENQQAGIMSNIRDSILPRRGVRVATKDIPDFPERTVSAELYDLNHPDEINRAYGQMAEAVALLSMWASQDKNSEHPLTKILRARQRIELLKIPIAIELAQDYLAKGYSVGIFVNFSQTLSELRQRLKSDCYIDGSVSGQAVRQRNIDNFNSNQEKLTIINSEAGGVAVSLPDVTGNHPRVGLIFPGFNAVTFRQILGRFHRESAKSDCYYRVIFAGKTVEQKIYTALKSKLHNLDSLNNSDFDICNQMLHL